MNVLVVADGHYYRDRVGNIYVQSVYDYTFYNRYLSVFDKVYAIARIESVERAPKGKKMSSGEGVEFLDFPPYRGPWQYAKMYPLVKKIAKKYAERFDCAIFRLPGATANIMCEEYSKTGKPFAVEIVIDPWENFAPGSGTGILRPIIRQRWTSVVRQMCMRANGTSYVTEHYLQEKYPCPALRGKVGYFSASYSSVELPDDSFAEPRIYVAKSKWYISHTANALVDYCKGHIQLMNAVKIVRKHGYDVNIRFIGDGSKKNEFRAYAESIGIGNAVEFLGRLPSATEVRQAVAETDMFVFPTRAEGLPRGLLEAMAEGMPCISSPTCGIPEVLDADNLFAYEDAEGFAIRIIEFIENPELMSKISKRNLGVSKRYASSILKNKRDTFYKQLFDVANKTCINK